MPGLASVAGRIPTTMRAGGVSKFDEGSRNCRKIHHRFGMPIADRRVSEVTVQRVSSINGNKTAISRGSEKSRRGKTPSVEVDSEEIGRW